MESPILARHSGIIIVLQFRFKLEFYHNLWRYISIFQQCDLFIQDLRKTDVYFEIKSYKDGFDL